MMIRKKIMSYNLVEKIDTTCYINIVEKAEVGVTKTEMHHKKHLC
jgi:hypothetical protein